MLLTNQLDLLIFLETTLLIYFLVEFRIIGAPVFDNRDWYQKGSACSSEIITPSIAALNLTREAIAFGDHADVNAWKFEICKASSPFQLLIGGFAVLLTMGTCYLYMLKGSCNHNLVVEQLTWRFYMSTFMGPYILTVFMAMFLTGVMFVYPCCYGPGVMSIGICFLISLGITYLLPYVDGHFNSAFLEAAKNEKDYKYSFRSFLQNLGCSCFGMLSKEVEVEAKKNQDENDEPDPVVEEVRRLLNLPENVTSADIKHAMKDLEEIAITRKASLAGRFSKHRRHSEARVVMVDS